MILATKFLSHQVGSQLHSLETPGRKDTLGASSDQPASSCGAPQVSRLARPTVQPNILHCHFDPVQLSELFIPTPPPMQASTGDPFGSPSPSSRQATSYSHVPPSIEQPLELAGPSRAQKRGASSRSESPPPPAKRLCGTVPTSLRLLREL